MNFDQIKKNIKYGDYNILQKLLKVSSVNIAKQKFLKGDNDAVEAMNAIQKSRIIFPYLHEELYELETLVEILRNKADKTYVDTKIQNISLTPGPQGVKGDRGSAGTNAIISGATATVSNTTGIPSVKVTSGGTVSNRTFTFDFANIKGDTGTQGPIGITGAQGLKGDKGDVGSAGTNATISGATATVSNTTGIPTVKVTSGGTVSNRTFAFDFTNIKGDTGAQGLKGDKGETGIQGPPGTSTKLKIENIYRASEFKEITANKTRFLISKEDYLQIDKGMQDGDELILCGDGQDWETKVEIPWMDRSGKIYSDLIFVAQSTRHFWWSDADSCWLDISTHITYK